MHLLQSEKVQHFLRQNIVAMVASIAANVFGAFNYLAARRVSSQVHPCIETMYIGIVQMLISFLCLIYYKPSYFKIWKAQYTQEQVLYTIIISSLYYISQESLSTALENLKAGTVATFNYLSVLIAYAGYKFFKVILLKKQLLGKTTIQQELWLQQRSASEKSNVQMSTQEMLGVSLIIGFNAVIMLSIINDDKAYLPPTAKHKEKFLRENGGQGKLCKECRQMEQDVRSADMNKYDERLS